MKLSRLGWLGLAFPAAAFANEANLVLPDLSSQTFMGSFNGQTLLLSGIVVSFLKPTWNMREKLLKT